MNRLWRIPQKVRKMNNQVLREQVLAKLAAHGRLDPEERAALTQLPETEADLLSQIADRLAYSSQYCFDPEDPMQEQSRMVIEATPVGICITNEVGDYEYVNPAYCTYYGYTSGDLLGQSFLTVVPPELKNELANLHSAFIQGQKEIRGEWKVLHRNGQTLDVIADAVRILGRDGRPRKVTIIQDISQRKAFEQKLKDEVLARESLEKLRDKVEAMIRHDLRNPLSGIMGSCQYLLMMKEDLDPEVLEMVQLMYLSAQKLNGLLHTTVDLVKLEQGSYEIEKKAVDVAPFLVHSIQESEFFADSRNIRILLRCRGIELHGKEPIMLEVHTTLFQTMLSNLVRNAIEASEEGDTITIDTQPEKQNDVPGYGFHFHNTGVIPESFRHVFLEKTVKSTKANGTGLGSYIIGLVVRAHKGVVSFESAPQTGTTIHVWFPQVQL